MLGRFLRLSKLATKILEIAGAGCASAVVASLLGNTHVPPHLPPPLPPPVVRLAPADEQMIRYVRDESAALVEQLRSASDARTAAAITPPAATPPKPKTVASSPARREQKPNRAQTAEAKQRPGEPLPIQSATVSTGSERAPSSIAAASDAQDARVTAVAAVPSESAAPTQVPSRLWSGAASSVRDAPRPPIGVGEFVSSSM